MVKSIDLFGVSLSLNFFKREKYKTFFGSLLSIALIGYFIYKVVIFIIDTINKNNYTQENNNFYEDNDIMLKNYEFFLCFSNTIPENNFIKFSDYFQVKYSESNFEINECKNSNLTMLEKFSNTSIGNNIINNCSCGRPKSDIVVYSDLLKTDYEYAFFRIFCKKKIV